MECILKTAEIIFHDNIKTCSDISLTGNVVERIKELASNISEQLMVNIANFLFHMMKALILMV